nr:MAG TPA: hypothetical protein [Caudoviricetes sp.]
MRWAKGKVQKVPRSIWPGDFFCILVQKNVRFGIDNRGEK